MEREKGFKVLGIVLTSVSVVWAIAVIFIGIFGHYNYNRDYQSSWDLAEKASTIPQKLEYIQQFVNVLEVSPMRGKHDALFFPTPDNSFEENLKALKSLQSRLIEIREMNPNSFEYNTAIQQITGQEQGEAQEMLSIFSGTWWIVNHFFLWNWVCVVHLCLILIMFIFGIRYWNYGTWE